MRRVPLLLLSILAFGAYNFSSRTSAQSASSPPVPTSYPGQPACRVKSIQNVPTTKFAELNKSPVSDLWTGIAYDDNGVSQIYVTKPGTNELQCITCTQVLGGPRVDRNKWMVNWHPSGQWLTVAVEEDSYGADWWPQLIKRTFLHSGIWMNMWITTPTGNRWYQVTDYSENGPVNGYTGVAFTPDGRKGIWAEALTGSDMLKDVFGVWKLNMADFLVSDNGRPLLANKRDITPAGAHWVEPANISPDGRHALLSTDIGLSDAQGQDQWTLDLDTGALQQLTNTPTVWDEHGLYSSNGKKIIFMSSYPYRDDPNSYKIFGSIRTEFMLMDADGSHLQQLTHFNVPGYSESQGKNTVAAVAWFIGDGSKVYGSTMGDGGIGNYWMINFEGRCGGQLGR